MSCPACNSRCGCDFSSKAEQLPSLVSIEVVGDILAQALGNTARRSEAVAAGDMSPDELQTADAKLADWLGVTFSGGNPHFASGEDWNPQGLSLYLTDLLSEDIRQVVGTIPEDPEEVVFAAVMVFMRDLYDFLSDFSQGGFSVAGAEKTPMGVAFINRWSRILTGAPAETLQ